MNYGGSLVLIWFIYIAWFRKTFPCYSQEHILRSLAPKELFPLGYLLRIYMLYSVYVCVCMPAKSLQSCTTLCNPMDCSPPVSLVHGVLQARILEWVAISSYRGSSLPRDQTCISCIGRRILLTEPPGSPYYIVGILYIYMSMENPMDRGAWKAIVHGVTKSQTWRSNETATTIYSSFHEHWL